MKAVVLAAGRGPRMRPPSDGTPKPTSPVGDRQLVEHVLDTSPNAGVPPSTEAHTRPGEVVTRDR